MITENKDFGKFTSAESARELVAEFQERLFTRLLKRIDGGIWKAANEGDEKETFDFSDTKCSDNTLSRILFEVKKNGYAVKLNGNLLTISWEKK